MADGSITFSTALDNELLEKDLARLKSKILKIEDDLSQNHFKKNTLAEQLKAAKEELNSLDKNRKIINGRLYDAAPEKFSEVSSKIRELEVQIQKYDKAISESNLNLDATKNRYGEIAAMLDQLRSTGQPQPSQADTDLQLQKMSENALQAKQRIIELADEYYKLLAKQNEGTGGDLSAQLADNFQQAEKQMEYINGLVQDDILGRLASGAEVAEYCIEQIKLSLQDLNEQRRNSASLSESEIAELDKTIAAYQNMLEAYQRNLNAADSKFGTSPELRRMAEEAGAANDHITKLQGRMEEIYKKRSLLLPTEKNAEYYDYLTAKVKSLGREMGECKKYLDQLAENDSLGQLANGAEIAEDRISDLENYLHILKKKKFALKITFASDEKKAELENKIARIEQLLGAYQRNLDAAGASGGFHNIADDAEVANQRIVELNQELLEMEQRRKELSEAGQGLGFQEYDQLVAKIAEAKRELRDYERTLTESSKAPEEQVNRASQAMEKLGSISSKVKGLLSPKDSEVPGQLLQVIEAIAPKLVDKIVPALEAVGGAIGGIVAKAVPILAALGLIIALLKKVAQAAIKMSQQFVGAVRNAVAGLWKAGETLAGWLSKGIDSAKKFGSTAVSVFSTAVKSLSKLMKQLNVFPKLADAIGSKLKRLGQMIRRVFVLSVITSGLRALRSQISAYLSLNEQFSTALRRLQGVLLTAFQPIYDAIVPALTTLIQVLSQAIAVVVQFFSALFGTTAKKAQASAKALYGQSKALKETGKAADEAAGSLAAFDEINTIQTEKNSGGGGGGGGADTGPLFDWDYDDETFGSWGEAFSAFLDKLLDGLPKLEAAFKKFADWLNDLAQKLYDMFTFPGVLDKVKALGEGLAEAFNKLVNWIDWELLGRALGAGLNLALNFLTSFLYAFDWFNLGKKLAAFVNGLVDEIDWYEFGRLLWAGFKIALETLAGFIMGLDMPLMAQAASNTIKGFFDEMYNTIQRIPWFRIGAQIASFLNNIDWYGCLTSVIKALQAALQAIQKLVAGFVLSLQWSDIAKQIYTAINDSFGRISWSQIGRTLGDAFVAVFHFVREVVKGIDWHLIGENIANFILGFDFVSALSALGQLIAAGINAAIRLACGFLDQMGPELRSMAEGIAKGLRQAITAVDWHALGDVIGRGIKGALSFVAGLLDPNLFYTIGRSIGNFLVSLDWVGIVGGLAEVLARAIGAAVAAVRGFLDSVKPNLKEIADGIAEKINQFFHDVDWAKLGQTISDGIKAALDFLIELMGQIDWDYIGKCIADLFTNIDWSGLLERWGQLLGECINAKLKAVDLSGALDVGANLVEGLVKGWWNKIKASGGIKGWLKSLIADPIINGVKALFGIHSPSTVFAEIGENLVAGLLQGIKEKWDSIMELFRSKVEAIKEFFSSAWESVKTATSTAWESIKRSLSSTWENLKTTAKTAFENIKTAISTAWDNVKSKTTEIWNNIKTSLTTTWENIKTTAKTAFENIKTAISTAWENVKSKTTEIWNNIKTTLTALWNELKTTAVNAFNEIKNKVIEVWTNIKNEAVSKWNEIKNTISQRINEIKADVSAKFSEIKSNISQAWENVKSSTSSVWSSIKSTVGGALSEIAGNVSSTFSSIVSSARSWGSDIASNISSGINGAANKVQSAVTGLANKINRNLHFSEPDEGPLKDFHTYMPDMLELMAEGIRDNTHLAVKAASDLAGSIADTVNGKNIGVNMNMPDISKFSIPLVAQGAAIPANREFTMVVQGEDGSNQERDILTQQAFRSEMARTTNLLHSIIEAIQDGKVITVDGNKFGRTAIATINSVNMAAGKQGLKL